MTLRPYQQRAVAASIDWMRKNTEPFLIEAATGAGKSHVIAEVARRIHEMTGKRVLCLAPSAELVTQNRAKYLASGFQASMFSASAGAKELRHPVVFGSPLTVKNRISRFCQAGDAGYAMVVLDECHGITPTVRGIIEAMRGANPNLRVMGLTATPYRLGTGYIFEMWPDGRANDEAVARDPYFMACVDRITAPSLIEQGYLTPPVIGDIGAERYDTGELAVNSRGQFDADAVDRAYHGHGRLTAQIVADVVQQAQDRRGVMFFAATVQHAREVLASLPPHLSEIVTGETPRKERESILARFKARQIKYLVNVSVLTTGFDAPHVDCIAILRKTESVGLLQQIIGRGLRLDKGKADCLVLDYTTNLDDHCPDGDLFRPVVKAGPAAGGSGEHEFLCEMCGGKNHFILRGDYVSRGELSVPADENGYLLDGTGARVKTEFGPVPVHFGRRCQRMTKHRGKWDRCEYRWTHKVCPHCDAENDISARYCVECRGEIVDPNTRLVADFRAMKSDPTQRQTDLIVSIEERPGVSKNGNNTMRLDIVTPYRSFSAWLLPESDYYKHQRAWAAYAAVRGDAKTVTYRKDAESGFYQVIGWNRPHDVSPDERQEEFAHAAE